MTKFEKFKQVSILVMGAYLDIGICLPAVGREFDYFAFIFPSTVEWDKRKGSL